MSDRSSIVASDRATAAAPSRAAPVDKVSGATSELELMQRLAHGEVGAMDELLKRFGAQLYRLVGRLAAWQHSHEDIYQEVLLAIWQNANRYRSSGSLEGWLRKLAVNTCRNQLRTMNAFARMLKRFAGLIRPTEEQDSPQTPPDERIEALRAALGQLKESDRTVLVLFYLEELPSDEIAGILRIKKESLHVRLHRARGRLQAILNPTEFSFD